MPETGSALSFLLQGLAWFGTAGGLALIYGFWDRKAKSKNDDRAHQSAEDKEWEAQRARFISDVIADRDGARKRAHEFEVECDACQREKDRVWDAARKLESFAHHQRHRLNNLIVTLRGMLSPSQRAMLGEELKSPPPVPSISGLMSTQEGAT